MYCNSGVYLAHAMPHVPLHAGETARGVLAQGLYGDVIQEIDASVGAVVDAIEAAGLGDRPTGVEGTDLREPGMFVPAPPDDETEHGDTKDDDAGDFDLTIPFARFAAFRQHAIDLRGRTGVCRAEGPHVR